MRSYLIIPDPQTSVAYVDRGGGIINKGQLASPWSVGVPVAYLSCEGSSAFREVESSQGQDRGFGLRLTGFTFWLHR